MAVIAGNAKSEKRKNRPGLVVVVQVVDAGAPLLVEAEQFVAEVSAGDVEHDAAQRDAQHAVRHAEHLAGRRLRHQPSVTCPSPSSIKFFVDQIIKPTAKESSSFQLMHRLPKPLTTQSKIDLFFKA